MYNYYRLSHKQIIRNGAVCKDLNLEEKKKFVMSRADRLRGTLTHGPHYTLLVIESS